MTILGSTGSIGTQTLDIVRRNPERFHITSLVAHSRWQELAEQAREFNVESVVIGDKSHYKSLKETLQGTNIEVMAGSEAIEEVARSYRSDTVVNALVGYAGLHPTYLAIESGKRIALANKETLVAAGQIVMDLAAKHNVKIFPVDSEHSAIFQCLMGSAGAGIEKIHLTASGGPFRTWNREDIAKATCAQALKHPNWAMGSKITIDSATMMNKGLEIIEARWLFGTPGEKIEVVVHPESIIHSMVEYADGSVIAQLGHPDMREPIQYALTWPARLPLNNRKLNFAELGQITFHAPDKEKFPALGLAYESLAKGGNMACIMNAANEAAVAAYLRDEIGFYDITDIVAECMAGSDFAAEPDLETIFATDKAVYAKAAELARAKAGRKSY